MKRIIFSLLAALLLCACQPQSVTDGRNVWKKYFHKVLTDPESMKIYEEKYVEIDDHTVQWTLDYGARNGFGAMVRKTVTFKTTHHIIDIDGQLIDVRDL